MTSKWLSITRLVGHEPYPSLRFSLSILSALSSSILPKFESLNSYSVGVRHILAIARPIHIPWLRLCTKATNRTYWERKMEPKPVSCSSCNICENIFLTKLLSGTTFTWTLKPCGTYFQIQYILKLVHSKMLTPNKNRYFSYFHG